MSALELLAGGDSLFWRVATYAVLGACLLVIVSAAVLLGTALIVAVGDWRLDRRRRAVRAELEAVQQDMAAEKRRAQLRAISEAGHRL